MAPKREKTTLSLAEFTKTIHSEAPAGEKTSSSWADEDLDLPSAPTGQTRPSYDGPGRIGRPHLEGGRGDRRYGRDEAPAPVFIDQKSLPKEPPFMAFVGGLSQQPTEEELRAFFSNSAVKSVRFPRPDERGFRGFCYVEFHSVEGLTEALMKSGQIFNGRPCRIDIGSAKAGSQSELDGKNWREGHKVVERASSFESRAPVRSGSFASSISNESSNWRSTAKPVEAARSDSFARPNTSSSRLSDNTTDKNDAPKAPAKPKPNPFGAARPREEVLASKGSQEGANN